MSDRPHSQTPAVVRAVTRERVHARSDVVATEEPLEIRVAAGGEHRTVAITMRTPGSDFDLACGFLYGEGVVDAREDVASVRYCLDPEVRDQQQYNVVTVDLVRRELPDLGGLDRHFYTTSACGVCGKASIEGVRELTRPATQPGPVVSAALLLELPERLRDAQRIFTRTGGLHAAALFDADGEVVAVREDVGRHNAMDKLVGSALLAGRLPFEDAIVLVSGRASFELVQKAVRAGAAFMCAVSAPSSLAVDVAKEFGMTLVGFLREDSFNVYSGDQRVLTESL